MITKEEFEKKIKHVGCVVDILHSINAFRKVAIEGKTPEEIIKIDIGVSKMIDTCLDVIYDEEGAF